MYNVYNGNIPPNLRHLFTIGTTAPYVTRQKDKFRICFRKTNIKAFCVSTLGCKLWNSLPAKLTKSKSVQMFKSKYKLFLLHNY